MRSVVGLFHILLISLLTVFGLPLKAQTNADKPFKPDIRRQLFHAYVDREQRSALAADGRADSTFYASPNDEVNFLVTEAITKRIDTLQYRIEINPSSDHNKKVSYLRGLENMLKKFSAEFKRRKYQASNFPLALDIFQKAVDADFKGRNLDLIIDAANYEVANLVVNSGAFDNNSSFPAVKHVLYRKYAHQYPGRVFYMLKSNPDLPFRDSLIKVAAYKYPRQLYDYAAASDKLGGAIRNMDDPLIKTVSKMSLSRGGQFYFAFLDEILNGRQTMTSIDSARGDSLKFYQLLVQTRLEYINRIQKKEKVWELAALTEMLEKRAKDVFIKTINALHNEPDPVRFRILQPLSPQELYYLIVFSENEIYTSSYVRGVYPLMLQKIGNRGDSLLMSVSFDRFKKFIKMAAGYNTLNHFLKTFPTDAQAKSLMTAFVNGLEKSENLEDGVDVADSYVSIFEGNPEMAKFMLDLTKFNYDKNLGQNKRGSVIYNLLYKLFLSADTSNNVDISKEFGIPPVYNVSYSSLADSSERVVMQVFFYGDEDGMNAYQGFLRQFSNSNWKTSYTDQWVSISASRGKPVLIFANKPLPEETGEDEKAQKALKNYLETQNLMPTVVIHRGHSYYAPYTIEQLAPSAKIVFLGSCGGYHLIHQVLRNAPEAHIIASKQIGKTIINQPFFNLLMEKLRTGNNIDWIPFWHEFGKVVPDKEGFQDYIPPHKNLGAIFIKAYKIAMNETEEEE